MKKNIILLLLFIYVISSSSQTPKKNFVQLIDSIKVQCGETIARNYLVSKRDSLEQNGELSSYVLLWGLLTSNMWNSNPNEALTAEYKEYLDVVINDTIKSEEYKPSLGELNLIYPLVHDYYTIQYCDGNKELSLSLLINLHRWFKPYPIARETIGYAQTLLDLCNILSRDFHDNKKCELYCKEYVDVSKSVYGEMSQQYAVALYNTACMSQTIASAQEKIDLIKKAIAIYEQSGIPKDNIYQQMKNEYNMLVAISTGVADVSNINLKNEELLSLEDCTLLIVGGQGESAIKSLLEHKRLQLEAEPIDTLRYASVINLIIQIYLNSGDLVSAQNEIDNFDKYIGINRQTLTPEYLQSFFSKAGIVAYHLKDYSKALRYEMAACRLFEQIGDYGMVYAENLANVAMIYADASINKGIEEHKLDAKWYIDEAISIFEERIGPLDQYGESGITLLSNKAIVYDAIGDREGAIMTLEYIVDKFSNNLNVRNAWSLAVNNLATMYMKQGQWSDAEKLLDNLNSNNDVNNYLFAQNLALCHLYLNDNQKTIKAIEDMNRYSTNNIANIFSYFAGIERNDYWTQISKELFVVNNLVAYHTNEGRAVSIAYNNALFCKNLSINSSMIMDKYCANSTDQNTKNTYLHYKELKGRLAYKSTKQSDKASLSREITRIEKELIDNIGDLGQLLKNETRTWKDIQQSLEKDEIAIEYCYAPRMEHYPDLQPYYGAFVLRKDYEYPKFVSLESVDIVEEIFDNNNPDEIFINDLYSLDNAVILYNMLWKKLMPHMEGVKTVYYAPTGRLFNINFDVLRSNDNIMLNEQYSMNRVSSTALIKKIKDADIDFKTSVLYGNVKYDETTADMKIASSSYNTYSGTEIHSGLALRSENERGIWGPIPATKKEIDNIDSLLNQNKIKVTIFEGNAANEESFKALSGKSPEILHLATHGFVIDTPQRAEGNKFVASTNVYSQKDSYMMWAGLMLAGGNNIWQGKFSLTDVEDGILTADEISRLDLRNTKLVVLSACETAKGKIDPVDGIYGLQRAFKMAGAQTIVMSLWKVQDDATSMLMTQFYTYLTSGIEKHQALWKAMMDVKEKYKDPYYWAGFIILD